MADCALGGLIPNGCLFGGPLKKKPGMQVSVMSFDGECVLAVVGVYTKEDAALLQSPWTGWSRKSLPTPGRNPTRPRILIA